MRQTWVIIFLLLISSRTAFVQGSVLSDELLKSFFQQVVEDKPGQRSSPQPALGHQSQKTRNKISSSNASYLFESNQDNTDPRSARGLRRDTGIVEREHSYTEIKEYGENDATTVRSLRYHSRYRRRPPKSEGTKGETKNNKGNTKQKPHVEKGYVGIEDFHHLFRGKEFTSSMPPATSVSCLLFSYPCVNVTSFNYAFV